MMNGSSQVPVSIQEFFALEFDGCNKHRAAMETGIAYPTIHALAKDGGTMRTEVGTLIRLREWSKSKGFPAYIDVEKSVNTETAA